MIACKVLRIPAGASCAFFKKNSEKSENSSTRGTPRRQHVPGRASPDSVAPNISFVKKSYLPYYLAPENGAISDGENGSLAASNRLKNFTLTEEREAPPLAGRA